MQRCSFCNNSILDYEQPVKENNRIYHPKCYNQSVGSRQTIDKTKELKQKLAEDYENQPKVIGALTLDEGRGFVIDPVTGQRKPANRPGDQLGHSPAGVKTQPGLQRP
ncbi:uncharacterized protein ACA1_071930 [Acanthamoeba castellanii str. Neff]|uniref:Uncharacterized protein n=1 Tax=Acanthamoeba castellanii (strain ATCC 30010 / Neff) TaxID=1257118 RepID=L8HGL6_ACACF|nr:uncharacterized protein ACA1_071930 [Acanthamoeba castellanii str. Neff]ELR23571.1 hypothetical protein ACA1_071930 [Acanthamoeba castellanii str. Neff]